LCADKGAELLLVLGRELLDGMSIAGGWGRSIPEMDARLVDRRLRLLEWACPWGGLDLDLDLESSFGEWDRPSSPGPSRFMERGGVMEEESSSWDGGRWPLRFKGGRGLGKGRWWGKPVSECGEKGEWGENGESELGGYEAER